MAASPSSAAGATTANSSPSSDPILRNALRYTISAREYALLHKYVISKSRALKRRAPTVEKVRNMMDGPQQMPQQQGRKGFIGGQGDKRRGSIKGKDVAPPTAQGADDYNAKAIRHSIRVFMATGAVMKLWGLAQTRLLGKKGDGGGKDRQGGLHKSPTLRLGLSLSTILFLYRVLFRFFTRLRVQLLEPSAAPFRKRNPKTASTLTSPYAPAVGASLAGLALGVYPAEQLRVTIALFLGFKAVEWGWNCAEENGMVWGWEKMGLGGKGKMRERPWWWGSWMLQPLAFGQLLHAAVFDRECFPKGFGNVVERFSLTYLHPKPEDFPAGMQWPTTEVVVDGIARMAKLSWPAFISPTLFPGKEDTLPPGLSPIAPLTSGAHPLITSLSCATLHPSDPSCTRTFLTFWLRSFPPLTRILLLVYSILMVPKMKSFYHFPVSTIQTLVSNALRMSTFLTGAVATAWSSICFFQSWFPRTFLPTQRMFLGGFLAGLWAIIEQGRQGSRQIFLYSAKASVESFWKVGVKRRWWRAMKGGDVWVFVAALMLTGLVYERDARAIKEGSWRKGISWVRGEGLRDWGVEVEEGEEDEEREKEE
ncbi:hypothetical protein QC763_403690 [Podospora pseudopauciseta]|uniref:Transmembrane protein 135 N-terminal domain-containing protein n=1 Tax=Podospora pseudopauciseta TaxID=2093780 RepID=A0ABR0HCB4_9PEZI|nr:hypothetical protein QC763_403690 [Podospora pseudopauciseta]